MVDTTGEVSAFDFVAFSGNQVEFFQNLVSCLYIYPPLTLPYRKKS
jgi:hypothetical protein